MTIEYDRLPTGEIVHRFELAGAELMFLASNLRQEKTGVHATITLGESGGEAVTASHINIEKREQRNPLAGELAKHLGYGDRGDEAKNLQRGLMLFCVGTPGLGGGLWDYHTGDQQAIVTVGDLEPSRAEFLIQDVVLRDGGTILFAPPGRGKSYTGLLLAQSLNYGREELWNVGHCMGSSGPVRDGDVDGRLEDGGERHLATPALSGASHALYLNLERSERSMERRLGQVNEALGLPRDAGMLMIHGRGKTLEKVMDGAARTIHERGCSLVVLDSLSRAGVGDLSSNEAANRAMDLLNGLGIAWLCLAHTPREDESHIYGSQMFDAAADLAIRMYTEVNNVRSEAGSRGSMGVVLRLVKTNDTAWFEPRLLVYNFNEFGLREAYVPEGEAGFAELMEKARS